jgi:phosphatidylinositol phospholipase C delta
MKGDMGQDLSVPLFAKYSENGKMGVQEFLKFLQEEQGESSLDLEDAKQILQQNLKESGSKFKLGPSNSMTKEEFCAYLLSPKLNGVLPKDVYQDMTQPFSHYFIFTGHNSYLTGNQLSSDSSDEPIKAALQRGVRVVELDLWPDDQGGVKVTHGNTLTKPVDFKKCIIAIRDNAFINSHYPVCVTLEDHLTCDLQAKAAEILTEILGDTLYYPQTSDALSEFPSPESLKNRIIISTKPPKEHLEANAAAKAALEDETLLQELKKEDAQEESSTVLIKEGSAGHRVGNVPVNVSEV